MFGREVEIERGALSVNENDDSSTRRVCCATTAVGRNCLQNRLAYDLTYNA